MHSKNKKAGVIEQYQLNRRKACTLQFYSPALLC